MAAKAFVLIETMVVAIRKGQGQISIDFRFTEEQERFRQEVRDFLEEELRHGSFKPSCDAWIQGFSPEFTKKVAQRGWIGLTWTKEYGGQGAAI